MKRRKNRQQHRQKTAMWEEDYTFNSRYDNLICDIEAFHWQLASNPDKNNIVLQYTIHRVLHRYKQVKCTSLYCVRSKQYTVAF